ncbi:MAG TPA: NADPH:quinone reductase [Stellaceae bacterium]|nr:NADPH:quinone reductase [Stellaceae bacterium]
MRAIWYDRQGPAAEVLQAGELPTPAARAGQVRVRLHASGVNPADCNRRAGRGWGMEFPRVIPNSDGAGVVDEVGEGADPALMGKRVWLYNGQRGRAFGTAAEYITLDAGLVTPLPDEVGFAEGATLGIPCMTAHRAVFFAAPVQGRTILVTGGAGAVGHYAVQLAAWAGARVIATVSSEEKAAQARSGGAHEVINYKTEDVAARVLALTDGAGVDHVVEVEFGGNLATTLKAVRENGSIATYASTAVRQPVVPIYELMFKNITLHALVLPRLPLEARRRAQSDITRWLRDGKRLLSVAARFPLAETVRAHEAVERGGKRGTVVVEIAA